MPSKYLRILMANILAAGTYYFCARAGLYFATINASASPVWPASGLAVALTILYGRAVLPAIWLGAFAANLYTGAEWYVAGLIALGNVCEAGAGRWIYNRVATAQRHIQNHTMAAGVAGASAFATMISASLGVSVLLATGNLSVANLRETWLTWWAGDALGVLLVTPFVLGLRGRTSWLDAGTRHVLAGLISILFTTLISYQIFSHEMGSGWLFAIFFCLLAAAWTLPPLGLRISALLIATLAIYFALHSRGPFNNSTLNLNLVHLQFFLASVALTSLTLEGFKRAGNMRAPAATLTAGWALSGLLFFALYQAETKSDQRHFDTLLTEGENRITSRIKSYEELSLAGAGLVAASREVEPQEWESFVALQDLPSRFLALHEMSLIFPGGQRLDASLRPLDGHGRSREGFRETEELARTSRRSVLVEDGPFHRLYCPIFGAKGNFRGWIVTVFNFDKVITRALSEYNSELSANIARPNQTGRWVRPLNFAQAKLNIEWKRSPNFHSAHDGKLAWAAFSAAMLTLLLAGFVSSLQSINERALALAAEKTKALNEIHEQYEIALKGSNDGIWDWNIPQGTVYYSARWKEIFGYQNDELESSFSTWRNLLHPDDIDRSKTTMDAYLDGKHSHYEFEGRFLHRDGKYRWCLVRGAALRDAYGVPIRMAGSLTDITDRKNSEIQIVAARETAEAATKAKSEFLANMSHEIRTPLTGLLGTAKLMRATPLNAVQLDYLEVIHQSADSLLVMLSDILDFSKIEANKVQLENIEFDLVEMATDVAKMMSFSAAQKGLDFETDIPEDLNRSVVGDPARIRQILLNLINNTVKFTAKGEVSFRVDILKYEAERVLIRFKVSDTGIGISKESLASIFAAFSQADSSTTRRFGGTGLGLSICKKLANLMNSDLNVQSQLNRGTQFWFDLDLPLGAGLQPIGHDENSAPLAVSVGAQILVAEDNQVNQRVLIELLKQAGYKARGANNGREALAAMKQGPVDLVLMDCQMPEVDGFEAASAWRASPHPLHARLPIIALTANATKAVRERALQSGMNDYLSKPVHFERLVRTIESWLAKAPYELQKLVIDEKKLAELADPASFGSPELLREVIEMYLTQSPAQVLKMSNAIRDEDWETLRKTAHSLKSASGTLGLDVLQRACLRIEDWIPNSGTRAELSEAVQEVARLLGEVKSQLQRRISSAA